MTDHDSGGSGRGRPRFPLRRRERRGPPQAHPVCGAPIRDTAEECLEELLEQLWMMAEEGCEAVTLSVLEERVPGVSASIERARSLGLVSVVGDVLNLEPACEERARQIVRRHRLAEVLLREILDLEEAEIETGACRFEHILSDKATESICTLLGHPPTCPHGKPIPHGECCEKFTRELTPLVIPLTELLPGEAARIVFIAPRSHARLDKLGALGIVPGSNVTLHQKRPTFVLKTGETDVAIDPEIAGEIFVRRL